MNLLRPLMAIVGEGLNSVVDSYDAFYYRVVGAPCRRKGDDIFLLGTFFDEVLLPSGASAAKGS